MSFDRPGVRSLLCIGGPWDGRRVDLLEGRDSVEAHVLNGGGEVSAFDFARQPMPVSVTHHLYVVRYFASAGETLGVLVLDQDRSFDIMRRLLEVYERTIAAESAQSRVHGRV